MRGSDHCDKLNSFDTDTCCDCRTARWITRAHRISLICIVFSLSCTQSYAFRCTPAMCEGLNRRETSSSCPSWRDPSNIDGMNRVRNTISKIGRVTTWIRHMQAGVEGLLPWLRAPDNRSGQVKYLDTCLALVSEDAMAAWLERQANVDLSQWGRGKAKHVRDLLKEVQPSLYHNLSSPVV
jgi:hypothetical protein